MSVADYLQLVITARTWLATAGHVAYRLAWPWAPIAIAAAVATWALTGGDDTRDGDTCTDIDAALERLCTTERHEWLQTLADIRALPETSYDHITREQGPR